MGVYGYKVDGNRLVVGEFSLPLRCSYEDGVGDLFGYIPVAKGGIVADVVLVEDLIYAVEDMFAPASLSRVAGDVILDLVELSDAMV